MFDIDSGLSRLTNNDYFGFDKYNLENFKAALKDPSKFRREIRNKGVVVNGLIYRHLVGEGTSVMEEDWDNLLILDGCRYDCFSEEHDLNGELDFRISKGSSSGEFLYNNFLNRRFHDTVYVTANPFTQVVKDSFHSVIDLIYNDEYYDFDQRTVLPETVVEETKTAIDRYPKKRLIIHFMQPHYPFLGETGRTLGFDDGIFDGSADLPDDVGGFQKEDHVWAALRRDDPNLDIERVWKAYRENLNIVLTHVDELLTELPGKTVISADHGNLIGDRTWPIPVREFGHRPGIHVPQVVKVPWFVIESDERRDVKADPPEPKKEREDELIKQRLEDLGYR